MFESAHKALNENRIVEAREQTRLLLGDYPSHYHAWLLLGHAQARLGDTASALRAFRQALSRNPGWTRPRIAIADILIAGGYTFEATSELQACLPLSSGSLATEVQKRIDAIRTGQKGITTTAISLPQPAASRTKEIETVFQKAVSLYESGETDKSLLIVRQVIGLQPDHGGAYFYGGLIRIRNGQDSMALYNFERGMRCPVNATTACYYIGRILSHRGEHGQAVEYLRTFLDKSNSGDTLRADAQRILERLNASTAQKNAVSLSTRRTASWTRDSQTAQQFAESDWVNALPAIVEQQSTFSGPAALGAANRQLIQSHWGGAARNLNAWLDTVTQSTWQGWALYNSAVCAFREGDFETAHRFLSEFRTVSPGHESIIAATTADVYCLVQTGRYREAQKLARIALRSQDSVLAVLNLLSIGDARLGEGAFGAAGSAYREASLRANNCRLRSRALYRLGICLSRRNRPDQAVSVLSSVADTSICTDFSPFAAGAIADIEAQFGRTDRAHRAYRAAAAAFPDCVEIAWWLYQTIKLTPSDKTNQDTTMAVGRLRRECTEDYWAQVYTRENPATASR